MTAGRVSEADKRATAKYHREKCFAVTVRFNKAQDSDIIEFIADQPCKVETFREAMRLLMAQKKS